MQKDVAAFEKGEIIQGFYMIKTAALKTTNANNRYIDLTIADRTGEVNGKIWDTSMVKDNELTDGCLVKLRGLVNDWQGQLQVKVEKIRLITPEDDVRIEDFVPAAPFSSESMLGDIIKYMMMIRNNDIKQITSAILNQNRDKLMHYPAAMKNHHSVRGGLLYHTLTMLRMAEKVMEIYTDLNRDLLYAGVILHDMAKIDEMDASELGIVSSYTAEGLLLGHIVQGIKNVETVGTEIGADREIIILLQHMILAHHYEPEFGSPKRPMIPEGEILHYLDLMDARMFDMRKALEAVEPGGFSDKVWLLHNRQMYKPVMTQDKADEKQQITGTGMDA